MFGLEEWVASGALNGGLLALVVALLIGIRHATDPDHLTAVAALVLERERDGGRRAGWLGLCWGSGHAVTLTAFGLPIVLFGRWLPDAAVSAAEVAIGAVIVWLAVRLLVRWRNGHYHAHPHRHGAVVHAHPHFHEGNKGHEVHERHDPGPDAVHEHRHRPARSPAAAFGIGLVHGVGGSAGAGVLLVASIPGTGRATLALLIYAFATALSMAAVSGAFGHALLREPVSRRLERLVPVLGTATLLFGLWYSIAAIDPALPLWLRGP